MESANPNPVLTVFIAEDHVAIRQILIAYLAGETKLNVIGQSGSGRESVELCLLLKPDVLLLDIDLPEMSGIAVCAQLTKELPVTRVLIFSSQIDAITVRQCLAAGARGIVEKSGSVETLLKAIETVGAGQAYFGEAAAEALKNSFSASAEKPTAETLTARELEVLQLIAQGCSNKEISSRLSISVKTVENHRHNMMSKIGAHNAADLTREAYRLGLLRDHPPSVSADRS